IARVARPPGGAVPGTDGVVTDRPGLALAVLTADCVPVLASDPEAGVIGAAHAGRAGAVDGIVPTLINAMASLGARPDRTGVLLGPAAAGDHYELPVEMVDEVERVLPGSRARTVAGTAGVDLRARPARRLARRGGPRVHAGPRCTIAAESLFSYRRQGRTGRQASLIWTQKWPGGGGARPPHRGARRAIVRDPRPRRGGTRGRRPRRRRGGPRRRHQVPPRRRRRAPGHARRAGSGGEPGPGGRRQGRRPGVRAPGSRGLRAVEHGRAHPVQEGRVRGGVGRPC